MASMRTRVLTDFVVLVIAAMLRRCAGVGVTKYEKSNRERVRRGATCADLVCATARNRIADSIVEYDPERKDLTLTLVNQSGKDIIAYNMSISDGSEDYLGRPNPPGEHLEDSLGWLIIEQMTGEKPPKDQPNGPIAAGATRSVIPGAKDIASVDLVVYADATAEVLNDRTFKQLVAMRKGSLMAMQKVSEALHRVLEDATIINPNAAAVEQLKRQLVEAKKLNNPEVAEGNRAVALQSAIADLERYQQPHFFSKTGTERDHLKEYVKDLDKRIALILPHTQIRVLESKYMYAAAVPAEKRRTWRPPASSSNDVGKNAENADRS